MQQAAAGQFRLVAEWCGPHVLVRRRDEAASERAFLAQLPATRDELFVSVSRAAHSASGLGPELSALLRPLLATAGLTPRALWLGIANLGDQGETCYRLASALGSDVLAPGSVFSAIPGIGAFAGHAVGGSGWYRFRPGEPAQLSSTRYPVPPWERALPVRALAREGVAIEPMPSGILLRDARAEPAAPGRIGCRVAMDLRFPKLLVGGSPLPAPAVVGEVLRSLPEEVRGAFVLVPLSPDAARHGWVAELASRLAKPVVFNTGVRRAHGVGVPATSVVDSNGRDVFRPFATTLRQPAGGGDQEVLDIAEPPAGWQRCGPRTYRPANGPAGGVLADVVPSGVVLHGAGTDAAADAVAAATPFTPTEWVLGLGTPGEPIGPGILGAAHRLLTGVDSARRAVARIRVSGQLDERGRSEVHRIASSAGITISPPIAGEPAPPAVPKPAPVDSVARRTPEPGARTPEAAAAPIVTMSAAPVSTMSSSPVRTTGTPEPDATEPEVSDVTGPEPGVADEQAPVVHDTPDAATGTGTDEGTGQQAEADGEAEVEPPAPPVHDGSGVRRKKLTDRVSTSTEQARFAAAAGSMFSDALATVNAAMATWPALRQGDQSGAKSDYVAVCLYLGRAAGGAEGVNAAMRSGTSAELDGQLPCLVSGIRRLPTHRRAVLRQSITPDSVEQRSKPGALLVEPGFLSASMNLDVTLPGACADVLIWPCKARRTSELALNRPVDEVVFLAGARFKTLAVRETPEEEEDEEPPEVPRTAVLCRELAPDEQESDAELDERDLAALSKLDRALAQRQQATIRRVEDPDALARLATPLVELTDVLGEDRRVPVAAGQS